MKGTKMKIRIYISFILFYFLTGSVQAIDKMYWYTECRSGQKCISFIDENGKTQLAGETPALILEKSDIRSAQWMIWTAASFPQPQKAFGILFGKEAAKKLGNIARENTGKKILMVFKNKILWASIVHSLGEYIAIAGERIQRVADCFWEFLDKDKLYLYEKCSLDHNCIHFAYDETGMTVPAMATPVLTLAKADIRSASIALMDGSWPNHRLDIKLEKKTLLKIGEIAQDKDLMVVVNNRFLSWLDLNYIAGTIAVRANEDRNRYYQEVPWLTDLVRASYKATNRSVIISAIKYLSIHISVLIAILAYIFWPRRNQRCDFNPGPIRT
jgi:hypothetical protein